MEGAKGLQLKCMLYYTVSHHDVRIHADKLSFCKLFALQWSYGFYLTHNQGQSGFEFFFKTKELKKKWLEQFTMAM